jgi:hypothetical protein
MSRTLTLANDRIRRAIAQAGYGTPAPNRLHLVGIRGATPVSPNALRPGPNVPDRYNDSIVVFGTTLRAFLASVDPGAYYTQHPTDADGCAHLCNGHWLYQLGTHRGHPALVQAGPVTVWRDRDRDQARDPHELTESGWFGINIHAGGRDLSVGPNSAGCQVIQGGWEGEAWTTFYSLCQRSGQARFGYCLLDALALG